MGSAVSDRPSLDPFSGLPPAERNWLRERTGRLNTIFQQTADGVIRTGAILREVKGRLEHGRFMEWVRACLPFSHATANRMMQVAERFDEIPHGAEFDAAALYLLSQTTTPATAREVALDWAERGRHITLPVARHLVATHSVKVGDDEEDDENDDSPEDTPLEDADGADDHEEEDEEAGPAPHALPPDLIPDDKMAMIGKALCDLIPAPQDGEAGLHIRVGYDDDEDPVCVGTYYPPAENSESHYVPRPVPRHEHGRDVLDLLLALAGKPQLKACNGCRKDRRLTLYADDANQPDGLNPRCKPCERVRAGMKGRRVRDE